MEKLLLRESTEMRKLSILAMLSMVLTSMSFASFDYVITDYQGSLHLKNNESLLVTGGGTHIIDADDNSYIEVQNTAPLQDDVGGIKAMFLTDYSTLNYYGGETGSIRFYNQAKATLQGGKINGIASHQYIYNDEQGQPIKNITIICRDYEYIANYDTAHSGAKIDLLTGTWMDGTSFSIRLVDVEGYAPTISNINIIPEPLTLALMGFGSLLLRRRK